MRAVYVFLLSLSLSLSVCWEFFPPHKVPDKVPDKGFRVQGLGFRV
jgi:hypothetical protein